MNHDCLYGMTALYDKSVTLDELAAAIDARYPGSAIPKAQGYPMRLWRVESERFAIQLSVTDKKDKKRGFAEIGTKQAVYIAFGGSSACDVP
jgi:hypothetical protein